jgi:hypothetical protein
VVTNTHYVGSFSIVQQTFEPVQGIIGHLCNLSRRDDVSLNGETLLSVRYLYDFVR